jgi:hypothetical protein
MKDMTALLIVFFFIMSDIATASEKYNLYFGTKINSVSFTENESSISSGSNDPGLQRTTAPETGSTSSINFIASAAIPLFPDRSLDLSAEFPILSTADGGLIGVSAAYTFYYRSIQEQIKKSSSSTEIEVKPSWSYFLSPLLSIDYLSYKTKSKLKTDFLIEFGGRAGVSIPIKDHKYTIKSHLGIARGIGFNVTTFNIDIGIMISSPF